MNTALALAQSGNGCSAPLDLSGSQTAGNQLEAIRDQVALVAALMQLPFLTVGQASVVAQTSPSSVRRACVSGALRATKISAKQWRIRPAALAEWLGGTGAS